MKVLSYSLFGDPSSFEFPFYFRGIYFNARMNQILYPDFVTRVSVDYDCLNIVRGMFEDLHGMGLLTWKPFKKAPRCESMLWRMEPIFENNPAPYENFTHVICRDADSVSTYREACCVYEWLESDLPFHAINDNAAHGGLMGGLVSFEVEKFKQLTGYISFDQMTKGYDFSKHGSDQNWMNKYLLPKIKQGLFVHQINGAGVPGVAKVKQTISPTNKVNPKLWVTDLISRYIGSAGVIDFELLRFFRSQPDQKKYDAFEKKYSDIMYWTR